MVNADPNGQSTPPGMTSFAPAPFGPASPEDAPSVDLWNYLNILRRRWPIILLSMVLAVGATAFMTLRMTKIYRATVTMRIETQAPRVLGKDVEAVDELGGGSMWGGIEFYETQYKIIQSRNVVSRVVREFKLNEDPVFMGVPLEQRSRFKPADIDAAAGMLQGKLTVEPVKDSHLVLLHMDDPDPKRAQLYANALAKAYSDSNLESTLQSTVDAVDWLAKQLDDAQKKLSDSENNAYDFKKENGILSVSLEERLNIVGSQMAAITSRLTEARAKRIEIQSRKTALIEVANADDPMSSPLDALVDNALIAGLKQTYGSLNQEYRELSERYGEKFPRMMELKAKLDQIKQDMTREVKNILAGVDAELSEARANEGGLQAALDDIRKNAFELSQKELLYNRLTRERDNNLKVYELLLGRSKEADLSGLLRVNNVHVLDAALLPGGPIKPDLRTNLMVALAVGLILGLALAMLIEFADRTIKSQEEVEAIGIDFLGIVPSMNAASMNASNYYPSKGRRERRRRSRPAKVEGDGAAPGIEAKVNLDRFTFDYPKSQVTESLRAIRTNLLFMSADRPVKRILVTSPSPQEGKTTVAINLAIVMAQSGSRVLLVDTDMRRPRVHSAFGIRPKVGISTLVLGECTAEEAIVHTEVPYLDILTCGPTPPNPAELMLTDRFAHVVEDLSDRYDRVIFDSPPIAVVTDAAILSKLVDGTVIIMKCLKTTRDAAKHAVSVLRDIGSPILGAVLNDLDLTNPKYGQRYYYYYYKRYGYYYGSDKEHGPDAGDTTERDERTAV